VIGYCHHIQSSQIHPLQKVVKGRQAVGRIVGMAMQIDSHRWLYLPKPRAF
jgi:hypothetical protein